MKPTFLDLNNPVTQAVMPLKEAAKDRAEQETRALVKRYADKLEEHGWDIRAAFPYPSSMKHGRNEYKAMRGRYETANRITKTREGTRYYGSMRDPHYVEIDQERVEKFVANAREEAATQYDMFVAKLCRKVGPVTEAKLHGTHVWGFSDLTVRKPDDTVEVWRTQQIVNQSVLGTLFNQWPTRKLKR